LSMRSLLWDKRSNQMYNAVDTLKRMLTVNDEALRIWRKLPSFYVSELFLQTAGASYQDASFVLHFGHQLLRSIDISPSFPMTGTCPHPTCSGSARVEISIRHAPHGLMLNVDHGIAPTAKVPFVLSVDTVQGTVEYRLELCMLYANAHSFVVAVGTDETCFVIDSNQAQISVQGYPPKRLSNEWPIDFNDSVRVLFYQRTTRPSGDIPISLSWFGREELLWRKWSHEEVELSQRPSTNVCPQCLAVSACSCASSSSSAVSKASSLSSSSALSLSHTPDIPPPSKRTKTSSNDPPLSVSAASRTIAPAHAPTEQLFAGLAGQGMAVDAPLAAELPINGVVLPGPIEHAVTEQGSPQPVHGSRMELDSDKEQQG